VFVGRPVLTELRKAVRIARSGGTQELAQRVTRAAYKRVGAASLEFPLLPDDVADSRHLRLPLPATRPDRSRRLRVGFVTTPPGLGSGGHTTMFRMISALEGAGHTCTLFLYDRYGGDAAVHEATIRRGWPWVAAQVRDATEGIDGVDGCVATSWQTAHVLARRAIQPMRRLYLVQDFEPFFYPRGSEYALAEDTYRFGFRHLTIGYGLAGLLRDIVGVSADAVPFGSDDEVYALRNADGPRDGVVFYARADAARRGFQLATIALQELHARRPETRIHIVGDAHVNVPFPALSHGTITPAALAELYNSVRAGVVLSFTNLSLLPDELLACGVVPVVNELEYAHADLKSRYVRWAPPTPLGIAEAALNVLDVPPDPRDVAGSAVRSGWRDGQAVFLSAVEDEIYGS
jgi:glycosyltransferase involved in cell wall biosynthesis